MSEEELYAGLSVASELVQRQMLSRNRRAIIKELVLRWDGQVMEAIRKYGSSDELGQELGAAAEREIQSVITDAFLEMKAAAGINTTDANAHLLSFSSVALALQNVNIRADNDVKCFCIESGMGELSIAVSMLEDFSNVHGIISTTGSANTNNNIIKTTDVVDRFDITFRPMLDMSLSNTFEFSLEANDWRSHNTDEWANADVVIVSLNDQADFEDFQRLSHKIKSDSYLIVVAANQSDKNEIKISEKEFDLLYTWENNDESDNVTYVYRRLDNSSSDIYAERYTSAAKNGNGKDNVPTTPTRATNKSSKKVRNPYGDVEYSSSPIGSSLMARKHIFQDNDNSNNNNNIDTESNNGNSYDKNTTNFDQTVSSPIGERLMVRKRIHSSTLNPGKKTSSSFSTGKNIPQSFNKPRRGWSEDSSDSDRESHNFNSKNTSSPIGSRLLKRKMQFSTRAPLPSSSLSSSSSISDDESYNNVIRNPNNDHRRRGVNFEFNLNQTPPKSGLSPLQRRLFMQGLNKKSNPTNDTSVNIEDAPSSPMGDALLLRRHKINSGNYNSDDKNNNNSNGLDFDISSPKSSRLLQRKHQLAQNGNSRNDYGKRIGIDFCSNSISSPKSSKLLARKHMISGGSKASEAWGESEK